MKNYIILFSISILFSQTDKMYVGDLDEEEVSLFSFGKKKTIEKVPFSNSYIIYGKFNGVNWETGEIDFVGNDGKLYSEPTFVKSIKNSNNKLYVQPIVLETFRKIKQNLIREQMQKECENNKSISVLVLPIKDDFYGFTEDIEETMATDGCYNVFSNETALEFLYNENIQLQNINDFLIGKIGQTVGVDYIIYGYASEYDIPYKYAAVGSNQSIQRVVPYNPDDYMTNLLVSINNWSVTAKEVSMRSIASSVAGTYITLTYYSIDIKTGGKKFLTKNKTMMKKG
jgi:hypothetical protein